jgi:D-alanyl-D-alanine carboxypeptidase
MVRRLPVLAVLAAAGVALSSGYDGKAGRVHAIRGIPGLGEAAVQVMASEPYEHSTWAISVAYLESGEMLVDHNSERFVEPASATKTYIVGRPG